MLLTDGSQSAPSVEMVISGPLVLGSNLYFSITELMEPGMGMDNAL